MGVLWRIETKVFRGESTTKGGNFSIRKVAREFCGSLSAKIVKVRNCYACCFPSKMNILELSVGKVFPRVEPLRNSFARDYFNYRKLVLFSVGERQPNVTYQLPNRNVFGRSESNRESVNGDIIQASNSIGSLEQHRISSKLHYGPR